MKKIADFIVKYRKKLIIILSVILAFIGLCNFYFVLEVTPQPNDECIWDLRKVAPDSAIYVFDQVKFEGVAWNAGIRDGDHLIAINGVKAADPFLANSLLLGMEGEYATYKIWRDGQIFTTEVRIKELILFDGLAFALFSFIWFIVGFVVVMARTEGTPQLLFFRIGGTLILFSMFNLLKINNGYNPVYNYPWLVYTIEFFKLAGSLLLPFLIIHFFFVFPVRSPLVDKKYTLKILYILPVTIFGVIFVWKIFLHHYLTLYTFALSFQGILYFLLIVSSIIGLVFLFKGYLKLDSPKDRNPIFIVLIGYMIGIGAAIYIILLADVIADNVYNSPEYFAPIILIAIVPVSFGYSVFRYSLMDVSDVVKNAVLYGIATIALAGVYFLSIYLIGQRISMAIGTEYQALIAGAIFILFAMVFQSTKDRMQDFITQKFYPEQFAYQRVLLNFSSYIAVIVGLNNILDAVKTIFTENLRLEKFAIVLRKKSGEGFFTARSLGTGGTELITEQDCSTLAAVLERKNKLGQKPVIDRSDFYEAFPASGEILRNEGIYTVVPLGVQSKIIGFLLFGLKHSGSQFSGKDLEILTAASSQVAVSVENARLYESEAEKKKMERDLENARRIQQKLLPGSLPEVKDLEVYGTMIPAMQVGGDYYDFIKVSDTKLFVMVGDVSGKGLSASFYMSKLQTMVRFFCNEKSTPLEVMKDINRYLYESIEKNWFITATLALFDTEMGTLSFCRAGHTPLVVVRDSHKLTYQPPGLGLGLEKGDIFDATLRQAEIKLKDGEVYAFYSDGIEETFNSSKEMFGEERFYRVLTENSGRPVDQLSGRVLKELKNFRAETEQYDDITLVLVRYGNKK